MSTKLTWRNFQVWEICSLHKRFLEIIFRQVWQVEIAFSNLGEYVTNALILVLEELFKMLIPVLFGSLDNTWKQETYQPYIFSLSHLPYVFLSHFILTWL